MKTCTQKTCRPFLWLSVFFILMFGFFSAGDTRLSFIHMLQAQEQNAPAIHKWAEYRDLRYGYGLAVPDHWTVYPTPTDGLFGAAILMNYEPPLGVTNGTWAEGAAKIQLDVFKTDGQVDLINWIKRSITEASSQIIDIYMEQIGKNQVVCAKFAVPGLEAATVYFFQMNSQQTLRMSVLPESGWSLPDIQAMLLTVVFTRQADITLPAISPQPLAVFAPASESITASRDGGKKKERQLQNAVKNSPLPLRIPFESGTTWQVGGPGYFYGEGTHNNNNNDYYATDWNMVGADDYGQPVYPVVEGEVSDVKLQTDGYGYHVVINHKDGVTTLYGHLSKIDVNKGDFVDIGTKIGQVGSTGNSTNSHLHLSFRVNGVSLNNDARSRLPGPMIAQLGSNYELWDLNDAEIRTVPTKGFFIDVPWDFWAKKWIDAVFVWGVMEAYPPNNYSLFSPDVPISRADAAVYWVLGYHGPDYTPPPATGTIFNDVPASHWAAAYIEQAYRDGFVSGTSTNPPLYSPDRILKRAEIAVIILRALHGTSYYPPTPTGIFADCPLDYWGTKWAEQLYRDGITSGCCSSPLQFCPENPVTRAEAAVFLLRSFKIYPKNTGGSGDPEVPITWQGNLVVKDAGNASATLTFGQAPSATDGLDAAFREIELPPMPPVGTFDARFELPGLPNINSLIDFRNDQGATTSWKVKFQPGSAGYPIRLKWNIAELTLGEFILKDAITGTIYRTNMKKVDSLVIANSAIGQMVIEKTTMVTRAVSIIPGWNMVSVPLMAMDRHYKTLFPDAVSSAFRYANGYVTTDSLKNGIGYWLKFNNAANYTISGFRAANREIAVQAGWNMIGPLESDIATTAITSVPTGIVQSNYFGFDNGYQVTTLLQMGKGYWVKVSQSGKLVLPEATALSKSESAFMTTDEIGSNFSNWTQIKLVANNGQSALLYLAPSSESDGCFDLPPVPPAGIFDARFRSGRYVASLDHGHLEVLIQSAQNPIKLKVSNLGDFALNIKDGHDGALFDQTLSEGQEVWLGQHLKQLILSKTTPMVSSVPEHYDLGQNYPNPFNPTSVISYALPDPGQVKISVYNILGKKVADLVNETQPAGYHQIEIDARNYASGIYYYVMKVNEFSAIKKMAIVK